MIAWAMEAFVGRSVIGPNPSAECYLWRSCGRHRLFSPGAFRRIRGHPSRYAISLMPQQTLVSWPLPQPVLLLKWLRQRRADCTALSFKLNKSSQVNTLPKAKSQAKNKRAKDRQKYAALRYKVSVAPPGFEVRRRMSRVAFRVFPAGRAGDTRPAICAITCFVSRFRVCVCM